METSTYRIGHVYICITMPEDMPRPENLSRFLVRYEEKEEFSGEERIHYTLEYTDDISTIQEDVQKEQLDYKKIIRENLCVFYTQTGECRCIYLFGASKPYAISSQRGEYEYHVWIDSQIKEMLTYDTVFVAMLSLERHMIQKDAMILHSAYMCYHNTAVLFSAPSETGKSTQASLWEKYRGTRTINGDRSLLIREKGSWYAYGWPVCGSSEVCENEVYPIRAIVMLRQAKTNQVYPLTGFQAVREIMEQITINSWNTDFQIKVMDQLEQLIQEVPVYRLECDISEQAVECLEQRLEMGEK